MFPDIEKLQHSPNEDDSLGRSILEKLKNFYWWSIPEKFVIFDLETTGIAPRTDRIIEIGAVSIEKSQFLKTGKVDTFQCFIKQDKPIPREAQHINKITDAMVKDGFDEYDAIAKFFEFCEGRQLLCYNSPFDMKFLKWTAKRCNYPIEQEYLESIEDIYKLAKKYLDSEFVPDKRLSTIAEKIGVRCEVSHRALVDSISALYVYLFLKQLAFNDENYELINNSKRLAVVTGCDEKSLVDSVMREINLRCG